MTDIPVTAEEIISELRNQLSDANYQNAMLNIVVRRQSSQLAELRSRPQEPLRALQTPQEALPPLPVPPLPPQGLSGSLNGLGGGSVN